MLLEYSIRKMYNMSTFIVLYHLYRLASYARSAPRLA
jgi:hypothetical protein